MPGDATSSASQRPTALLADDHPLVREGLRRIIERTALVDVVGEAGDGRTLVAMALACAPDLVITDITMPDLDGIEATRAIHKAKPRVRVIVLSVHATETCLLDAMEAGASGYLLKDASAIEIEQALRAVLGGKAFFSPALAGLLAQRVTTRIKRRSPLSPREREVVQLIAEGQPLGVIASKLFISVATAKSHRANAMRKLGLRTTAGLVRWAMDNGLLP
jgi:DNA-binding NarL/FixJ family response regulator